MDDIYTSPSKRMLAQGRTISLYMRAGLLIGAYNTTMSRAFLKGFIRCKDEEKVENILELSNVKIFERRNTDER